MQASYAVPYKQNEFSSACKYQAISPVTMIIEQGLLNLNIQMKWRSNV